MCLSPCDNCRRRPDKEVMPPLASVKLPDDTSPAIPSPEATSPPLESPSTVFNGGDSAEGGGDGADGQARNAPKPQKRHDWPTPPALHPSPPAWSGDCGSLQAASKKHGSTAPAQTAAGVAVQGSTSTTSRHCGVVHHGTSESKRVRTCSTMTASVMVADAEVVRCSVYTETVYVAGASCGASGGGAGARGGSGGGGDGLEGGIDGASRMAQLMDDVASRSSGAITQRRAASPCW